MAFGDRAKGFLRGRPIVGPILFPQTPPPSPPPDDGQPPPDDGQPPPPPPPPPPSDSVPVATFSYTPTSPTTADVVRFDGSSSEDSDGSINTWDWDFGDGSRAVGAVVSRQYNTPGTYTVHLTVTDDDGNHGQTSRTVTVTQSTTPTGGGSQTTEDEVVLVARGSYVGNGLQSGQRIPLSFNPERVVIMARGNFESQPGTVQEGTVYFEGIQPGTEPFTAVHRVGGPTEIDKYGQAGGGTDAPLRLHIAGNGFDVGHNEMLSPNAKGVTYHFAAYGPPEGSSAAAQALQTPARMLLSRPRLIR